MMHSRKWRFPWPSTAFPLLLLGLIATSYLPHLASEAQNPDGLEIIMAARFNTLPHPPGNPLYLWLAKLAWHFFPAPLSLSLLSWPFFAAAGIIFYFTLRQFCGQRWMALWGAALWLSFPAAAALGTSPEKYALLYFIEALFFYGLSKEKFYLSCTALGLMAAHHDSFVLLLIILPFAFWRTNRPTDMALNSTPLTTTSFLGCKKILGGFTLAVGIALGAYTTNFFLNPNILWPNFGPCHNWRELIKVVTFRGFGQSDNLSWSSMLSFFNFWSKPFGQTFFSHIAESWTYLSWIFLSCGMLTIRSPKRWPRFTWAIIIYLFLALCCLSLGNLATNDYGLGYLARYHTIILLPAICLMVFGLQIIIQYLTTWEKKFKSQVLNLARWAKISIVILFLLPGQSWYLAQHVLQGHHNQILTTWQNLIGSELSTENIWLEDHDYLIFGGVLQNRALAAKFYGPSVTLNLPHRFPLFMVFFLPLGSMEKAAYLEPRFLEVAAQFREFDANLFDLGRYFQDKGHAIQTMIPAFLQRFPHYRQGLTYILPPPELASSLIPAHQTLDHYHHLALHLCQGLNHIQGPVPQEQNYFQKILLQDWQKFFQEYYYLLQVKQGPKASIITAAQLAQTVVPGVDPQLWRKLCHAISKEEMRKIKENKI